MTSRRLCVCTGCVASAQVILVQSEGCDLTLGSPDRGRLILASRVPVHRLAWSCHEHHALQLMRWGAAPVSLGQRVGGALSRPHVGPTPDSCGTVDDGPSCPTSGGREIGRGGIWAAFRVFCVVLALGFFTRLESLAPPMGYP